MIKTGNRNQIYYKEKIVEEIESVLGFLVVAFILVK
jgi:hypothetical protein